MAMCMIEVCSYSGNDIKKEMCPKHYRRYLRHGDPLYINVKCNRDGNAKERKYEKVRQWKNANKEYYRAYLNARKKRVKLATPKWANIWAIQAFYANTPSGHHVDHIIPINGDNVSGLHVLNNLQYLPAIENLRKRNKVA